MELSTFSGHRRDWPEFKTVWRSVAESALRNKTALAHELKRSVRGEASKRIKLVYVTKPEAYDTMWQKLESYYEDVGASVQAALDDLRKLKPVASEDFKGLVELVDVVESAYSQLSELGNLNVLTMRDVDRITELLPNHLKVEWRRRYRDLTSAEKIRPFVSFMKFLETSYYVGKQSPKKYYKCAFPALRKDNINHTTEECKEFQKLPISGKNGKYQLLKEINACYECFGNHLRQNCPSNVRCNCDSTHHHKMLCDAKPRSDYPNEEQVKGDKKGTYVAQSDSLSLYPIYQVLVSGCNKSVTVFCDEGSNASYITHRAAQRINARKLGKVALDVTTMGNVERTHHTQQYKFTITTNTGKRVTIRAYGMEQITGKFNKLDPEVLKKLLPEYDPESLHRKSANVDILPGCDFFGLYPKHEEAKCGENLSVMSEELGTCLQETNPELSERTKHDSNLAKVIHEVRARVETYRAQADVHSEFLSISTCSSLEKQESYSSHLSKSVHLTHDKKKERSVKNFILGEELGTEVVPGCGGRRCGKCPTVGHTYSFREEQELDIIRKNLEYDEVLQCWVTGYPWTVDPNGLPDNYRAALSTLKKTERTLTKDVVWAGKYQEQIQDMIDWKVARKPKKYESGRVQYFTYLIWPCTILNRSLLPFVLSSIRAKSSMVFH